MLTLIKASDIAKNTNIALTILDDIRNEETVSCHDLQSRLDTFRSDLETNVELADEQDQKPMYLSAPAVMRDALVQDIFIEVLQDLYPSIDCGFYDNGMAYAVGGEWGADVDIDDLEKLDAVWELQAAEDRAWVESE